MSELCRCAQKMLSWDLTQPSADYSLQYSYDKKREEQNYVKFTPDGVCLTLREGDLPFRKGSETMPRTEIRCMKMVDEGTYTFRFKFKILAAPEGMQYSVLQLFDRNPCVMLRKRENKWQVVVFESKDKITVIENGVLDEQGWNVVSINIKSGRKGTVDVMINGVAVTSVEARLAFRNKLHWKIGPYAQQMEPIGTTTILYEYITLEEVKSDSK